MPGAFYGTHAAGKAKLFHDHGVVIHKVDGIGGAVLFTDAAGNTADAALVFSL